jgi:hypothetical protein
MLDATDFLRLAVDPVRLAILGRGAVGVVDADEIVSALGVAPRRVSREMARLAGAGLLVDGRLATEALRALARSLPQERAADPAVLEGPWGPDEARVLATFFSGSRLATIPSQRAKRVVVLERLVQEFEPGLRYSEREVDSTLQRFHPDHASLRRYLVDEEFLTRADGVYWRTGGRTN